MNKLGSKGRHQTGKKIANAQQLKTKEVEYPAMAFSAPK